MNAQKITTNLRSKQHWYCEPLLPYEGKIHYSRAVCLYPQLTGQTFEGFGGAFTESAGYNWEKLNEPAKSEFAQMCFGADGLGYTLGRTHIGSCDFALGNYAAWDASMTGFDMSRDEKYIFPLLRAASAVIGQSPELLLSPWSPPAFMKTNGDMNHGGKLKPEYRAAWAQCMAEYVRRYREAGFTVRLISVQNEPEAVQTWDSCLYTAEEEGAFAAEYLRPALDAAGQQDVSILIWDHNKEELVRRVAESMNTEKRRAAIGGAAFHWYHGDHFEAVALAKKLFPDKKFYFSEGCIEYSRLDGATDLEKAEMYAHDILGNLNAGINGSLDWNLLLDEKGGPNHVGNYCEAPIMLDGNGGLERKGSYWYIGQFSRYIRPGAVRIETSRWCSELEVTAFRNTDGSTAVVMLNRTDAALPAYLVHNGMDLLAYIEVQPHTIVTVVL